MQKDCTFTLHETLQDPVPYSECCSEASGGVGWGLFFGECMPCLPVEIPLDDSIAQGVDTPSGEHLF